LMQRWWTRWRHAMMMDGRRVAGAGWWYYD
jgi:hypothetical protein